MSQSSVPWVQAPLRGGETVGGTPDADLRHVRSRMHLIQKKTGKARAAWQPRLADSPVELPLT
jgi:hypothetical protein